MKALFGGILLAIGILIAGASGLCTLVFFISSFGKGMGEAIPLMLVVGGIPMAIGALLIYAGRYLLRRDDDA